MKRLSRILTVLLCCAPLGAVHGAPVATTSGSNLTSFNPSNSYNNQWATMSNGRYDGNTSAKVDFGNCNSVVLRCAQPKCANGGCADMSVASTIVEGCVKSNDKCKQYGDDLIKFMSAQLVASSNAKINEQNAALEQAKIQAEAQAAAAANAQSQQQMAAMQQQMQQMQMQMQQQQQESAQQLQNALAQQQAQSQQAIDDMKNAATAAAQQTEAGISSYQQEAINRGISEDVLARQKISGQVITEIENAEVSLKEVKAAMNSSFEYAGCDTRGNNCEGPKRVKKWRELAHGFIDPYNNTIDKIYEALTVAQGVGVDLSDIYMMLDDSCNSWGQYMCQAGAHIRYVASDNSDKGTPFSCSSAVDDCYAEADGTVKSASKQMECYRSKGCRPCTLLKILANKEEIYEGWVSPTVTKDDTGTVISCASNALNNSKFFASRARRKSGANLVDIDALDVWINQSEPKTKSRNDTDNERAMSYCSTSATNIDDLTTELEKAISGKTVKTDNLCFKKVGTKDASKKDDEGECTYINPDYAICDTHPYNIRRPNMTKDTSDPENCTDVARHISSTYENKTEILYAKWNTNHQCEVLLCRGKFKANDNHNGCTTCTQDNCSDDAGRADAINKWNSSLTEYNEVAEAVRLKITVLSQQMYKQYEYINATLRRLKTQLEKAVLTANLEAAGATSGSSSGLLGASGSDDKSVFLPGTSNCMNFSGYDDAYRCLQTNVNAIIANASGSSAKNACLQLQATLFAAESILSATNTAAYKDKTSTTDPNTKIKGVCQAYISGKSNSRTCNNQNKTDITQCAQALNVAIMNEKRDQERADRQYQNPYR